MPSVWPNPTARPRCAWRPLGRRGVLVAERRSMVIRALTTVFLTGQACLSGPPGGADAGMAVPDAALDTSPPTPRLAANQLVFDSTRSSINHEIFVMKTDGTETTRLTIDAAYENWWPRIS